MISYFFFGKPMPTDWLRLFRIGTGILLLLTGLQLWPDFDLLYGSEGLVDHRLLTLGSDYLTDLIGILPMSRWFLVAYLAGCLLLIAGVATRMAAIVLWLLHQWLYMVHIGFSYGFDYLACSALFYCIVFPLPNPSSRWTRPCLRILQLHLCLIYFFGGLDKMLGPTWHNGEALWKTLHLPDLVGALRPDISFLAPYPVVVTLFGWGIILLELFYPLCIWLVPTRRIWLAAIVAMHAGIALFLGLYHFSALMILFNICAFLLPYTKPRSNYEQIATQITKPATPLFHLGGPPERQ